MRFIWMGLVLDADDAGRGWADPVLLSRKFDVTPEDIVQALKECEAQGILECYEVEGEYYYWLPEWHKLQTLTHPSDSRFPPAPGEMTAPQKFQKKNRKSLKNSLEGEGEEEESESTPKQKRRERAMMANRGVNAATTAAAESVSNEDIYVTNDPTDSATTAATEEEGKNNNTDVTNPQADAAIALSVLLRDVANALKLPVTLDLMKLVRDYQGKVAMLTEAHLARNYVDDPNRNKRRKEMSVAYFRDWLERGLKFMEEDKAKYRAEVARTIGEIARQRAG